MPARHMARAPPQWRQHRRDFSPHSGFQSPPQMGPFSGFGPPYVAKRQPRRDSRALAGLRGDASFHQIGDPFTPPFLVVAAPLAAATNDAGGSTPDADEGRFSEDYYNLLKRLYGRRLGRELTDQYNSRPDQQGEQGDLPRVIEKREDG